MALHTDTSLLGVRLALILFLLLGATVVSAQSMSVPVTTLDSTANTPLEYVMVVATDTTTGRIIFERTDASGRVSLPLAAGIFYRLEANSLGYAPFRGSLQLTESPPNPIVLRLVKRVTTLGEIIVRDTLPPVSYRPDTVTYNAKAFYTGQERKLKDLIEKMPGLHVDRDMKVTYRGEDVSTLLVEGKPFFGGDGELALKGLPAGAVGRVQVLEDYKPLGFTIDPGARKRRALNIIIREEKNNVYFGELLAGAGLPNRHLAQADVFRFNRRTNNYLFAGSNNVERELLSFRSIMRLIGGDQLFTGDGFRELSDLSLRLSPPLFARDGNNQLAALGINQDVGKRSTLDLYGLFPRKVWSGQQNTATLFQTTGLEESTESVRAVTQQFGMLRATLTNKLAKQLVIRTTAQLHGTYEKRGTDEAYRSNLGNRTTNSQREVLNFEGQLKTAVVKRYESGNLLKLNAAARRQSNDEMLTLNSDTTFLGSLLSFNEGEANTFKQQNTPLRTAYQFNYRYHYRLSRKVYLEHGTGWENTHQDQSVTASRLPTSSRLVTYRQLNTDLGAVVKIKETDAVVRLHLTQPFGFTNGQRVFSSSYLLPEARLKFRAGPGSNLEMSWRSEATAPEATALTAGPLVGSFTSYSFGLDVPRPTLSHSASVSYRYYNPIKGFGYDLAAGFGQQGGPAVISRLSVLGVDRSIGYLVVDTPGRSWNATLGARKNLGVSKLRLIGSYRKRQQLTLIGEEVIVSPVATGRLRGELRHNIGEDLDLKWWFRADRSTFAASDRSALYNGSLTSEATYDLGRWSVEAKATGQLFDATGVAAFTGRLRGSVRYVLHDSPWAFALNYSTPVGGRVYRNFRQSDLFFTATDTRVFVPFLAGSVAFQF